MEGGGLHGSGSKHIDPTAQKALIERTGAADGDLLLLAADTPEVSAVSLGQVRRFLGRKLGLAAPDDFKFV